MIKWIAIGLTSLGMVVGAVFFLEDRYENEADAIETKTEVADLKQVSQEQIDTLQSMQRSNDTVTLESLQNQKFLLKKQLEKYLNNELLKEKIDRLENLIKKLENKLYN